MEGKYFLKFPGDVGSGN